MKKQTPKQIRAMAEKIVCSAISKDNPMYEAAVLKQIARLERKLPVDK
jgi:hypothetical protein